MGLLVISYNPAVFEEAFGTKSDPTSYYIILDRENRIIYHPERRFIGYTLSDGLTSQMQQNKGYFTQAIDGKNMLVVYDDTQKGNWKVARFIPLNDIISKANSMTWIFMLLIVLSLAVTVAFGFIMSKQIVEPINMVTNTFKRLQSGDFTEVSRFKVVNQDEISQLGALFNSFIDAREDITTQKKLERQLNQQNQELQQTLESLRTAQAQMVQQEKMAGIGVLAAGVAHEINNPLGFVTSNFTVLNKYVGFLENMFKISDEIRVMKEPDFAVLMPKLKKAWEDNHMELLRSDLSEIISDTQEGLTRIARIVNALKAFSRINTLEEKSYYDLNEGIKTTLLIANNEIKYNSEVRYIPEPLPEIYANGGQINQVLLNIIVNAAQAIKQKQHSEKGLIIIKTFTQNNFICCEITDSGTGMTNEVMNRIFEPFFTTKEVGQGTGLGLSLAYDIIVNKHSGRLEVKSEYGIGTTFSIYIPVTQKKSEVL